MVNLKFLKGMFKDTGRTDQPDDTYRDALNAVIDPTKIAVSNEYGTKLTVNIITSQNRLVNPVGQIALPNDDFIIFGVEGTRSYITYVDTKVNSFEFLLITPGNPGLLQPELGDLNFDLNHTVYGEFRISPTGDIIIYFTDNYYNLATEPNTGIDYISSYNPPRVFNVSKQKRFLTDNPLATPFYLYNLPGAKIDTLNIFKHSGPIPQFNDVQILRGGGVESGTYFLGLSYADEDFTETNVLTVSNPVYIVPADEATIPFEMISGAPNETQTAKSIAWEVEVPSSDYKYVVPYVIQRIGTAQFVYKLEPVEISSNFNVVYSGTETVASAAVEDTVIDKVRYLTCRSLTQLDNRLYMANLTGRKDLGFQRFANRIKLSVGTQKIENFDPRRYDHYNLNEGYAKIINPDAADGFQDDSLTPNDYWKQDGRMFPYLENIIALQQNASKGYRDSSLLYKKKTYRRGEVYAFYISLVLKDGSETFAYHIPGRNIVNATEKEQVINVPGLEETARFDPEALVYQYADTSLLTTNESTGFWENQHETYPSSPEFEIWGTNSLGIPQYEDTLANKKVRHHKMPSNKNANFSFIEQGSDFSTPNLSNDSGDEGDVTFEESVRILFVQLSDIKIPRFILEQIQGFKVYYAKRTQPNKTIIGQSASFPAVPILAGSLSNQRENAVRDSKHMMWYMSGFTHSRSLITENAATSGTYLGHPVIQMHDFNLLRKKHTVATTTHVDIQYIMTMQYWRGGYKNAAPTLVGGEWRFKTFRAGGYGDDDYAWVHPDLGNTIDYEYDPNNISFDIAGPKNLDGRVVIAAKYSRPGQAGADIGTGSSSGYWTESNQDQILSGLRSVFMIEPDGATYLQGLSFLKNVSSTAFKGATYLVNNSGESSIALSLASGLPVLRGFYSDAWLDKGGEAYTINQFGVSLPNRTTIQKSEASIGRPNFYLLNLCSAKTDVFEPFDAQQLVFTGYYHPIDSKINYETGQGQNPFQKAEIDSYYTGVTTSAIFGGDTFICRYGYRVTSQSFAMKYFAKGINASWPSNANSDWGKWLYGDIPVDIVNGRTYGNRVLFGIGNLGQRLHTIENESNWVKGDVDPVSTVIQYFVESDDNINFRHAGDIERGVPVSNSLYFDKFTAADVMYRSPLADLTKMDNILYEDQYSLVQDIRVTIPFSKRDKSTNLFPNRVIRSVVQDGNFNDTYSYFLALDYKDFAQNKGQITNIFKLDNLLYIHTERSLFRTKGKQNLELGDATQAYIGTGDLFAQEPDEFIQTQEGYVGNYNLFGSLLTKEGYVFVAYKARKIFLITGQVAELSENGLDTWCDENIPFTLEAFGYNFTNINIDAPTGDYGFITSYDPGFSRILITKKEIAPTQTFINLFNAGTIVYDPVENVFINKKQERKLNFSDPTYFVKSGWTLSFSTTFKVWASRHTYLPPLYAYNSTTLYSFDPDFPSKMYSHDDMENPGLIYDKLANFEIDFIMTGEIVRSQQGIMNSKIQDKIAQSVKFFTEVFTKTPRNIQQVKQQFNPGFTSFYIYNTYQISGETELIYLKNIRKTDNEWSFNDFRDLSNTVVSTSLVNGQVNVQGNDYLGSTVTSEDISMFLTEGVINPAYINPNKPWYEKRKFVDKFIGVRLIANNESKTLINLYSASVAYRQSFR
jgi:hypothetical protein